MRTMTCARFDDRLGDFLEGELSTAERSAVEAHAGTCARCGSLLADVRGIVRGAAALPQLTPSRDLWEGIAARIEAPVVGLDARQAPVVVRRGLSWRGAAAAAAVLVAVTALATWQLAVDDAGPAAPAERVATTETAPSVDSAPVPVSSDTGAPSLAAAPERDAPTRLTPEPRSAAPGAATAVRNATTPNATSVYDREIASLRRMLETRRDELDTATVRVLEENLSIIDRAIEQSRQALVRDPNSTFLADHLNDALGRKVELLRTATLLQSSS